MINKFYDTFFPSKEVLDKRKKLELKLINDAREKKHCIACKHYSYNASIPAFITYEGDCDVGNTAWFSENPDGICKDYEVKNETDEI